MQSEIRFCSHDIQGRIGEKVITRCVRGTPSSAETKRTLRNAAITRTIGTETRTETRTEVRIESGIEREREKDEWSGKGVRFDGSGNGET